MPRRLLITLALCRAVTAQQVPTAARQQDLTYISTQFPKLHPNFFFQLDPAQFQRAVDALSAKVNTATDAEFYVGLAQLVAMAGDGHTSLFFFNIQGAALVFRTFPLAYRWLDDGIFVTAAAAPYTRALGTQLIAVGGTPIAQVIAKLATVISHNNDQGVQFLAQQYLAGQTILQGLGIVPSPLTFRTLGGEEFSLDVSAGSAPLVSAPDPAAGPIPDYIRNASLNYWYTYSAPNKLLYFKYNQCDDDPAHPFAAFAADVLKTMDQNPVETFVFDFRGNTGGSDALWGALVEGLQVRLPSYLANPRFRIYAAIDKGTASSAMDDAMALKQPFPGLTIQLFGEPTSGKPAEYGLVHQVLLPGSGLLAQYSTTYFPNPDYIPDLPSLMPDVPVSIRSTDYFARHDPVMAAILARTASAPAMPSGNVITVNGASYRTDQGIAPGSLAAAFGAFSRVPDQVVVGGVAATIVSAAQSQVNFLVPSSLLPGVTSISVSAAGTELGSGKLSISAAGPGIFILGAADPSQPGAVENQDYSVNSAPNPAKAGSVVQIFATGYSTAPVQAMIGGVPAQVLYSGSVGPGLWQINAQVPAGIAGEVPVFLIAGNLTSNAVTISVR